MSFSGTLNAIKLIRTQQPALLFSSSCSSRAFPSYVGQKATGIRFQQAAAGPKNNGDKMEKDAQKNKPHSKKGDVMSESFGEGYATRSEEEGFGGIYGGNQSEDDEDKIVHGKSPEHDKSQGSQVKEKKA